VTEPLFKTSQAALTFAYNATHAVQTRPAMSKMADKSASSSGKGLIGVDAAAQAGMILEPIKSLSRLDKAILLARFAPRGSACPCCGGAVPNLIWLGAIREISDAAVTQALTGHITMRVLRDGLVMRYFGEKVHLQKLAKQAEVAPNTVTAQNSQIVQWLHGTRTTKKGTERVDGIKGVEQLAMDRVDAILRGIGIVGEPE